MIEQVNTIQRLIVDDLERAGASSPYVSDANEPDPRYKSYGVRAAGKKVIIAKYKKSILKLSVEQRIQLATKLIESRYGEQQSVALSILEQTPDYFSPDNFEGLDFLVRCIHGWSKVDAFTGSFLRDILFKFPNEFTDLVRQWNTDNDLWLRRMSAVLFTRKVAKSGIFTTVALEMCDNLLFDKEPLVLKGVGWCLKDLMKIEKEQILTYVKKLRARRVSSIVTLYALKEIKGKERTEILKK